mgnify:CR=1 FL=1
MIIVSVPLLPLKLNQKLSKRREEVSVPKNLLLKFSLELNISKPSKKKYQDELNDVKFGNRNYSIFYIFVAVEGWVIFVTGLNEEVSEEDVEDKFTDFGKVREVRMNLDHRTGYVKVSLQN